MGTRSWGLHSYLHPGSCRQFRTRGTPHPMQPPKASFSCVMTGGGGWTALGGRERGLLPPLRPEPLPSSLMLYQYHCSRACAFSHVLVWERKHCKVAWQPGALPGGLFLPSSHCICFGFLRKAGREGRTKLEREQKPRSWTKNHLLWFQQGLDKTETRRSGSTKTQFRKWIQSNLRHGRKVLKEWEA